MQGRPSANGWRKQRRVVNIVRSYLLGAPPARFDVVGATLASEESAEVEVVASASHAGWLCLDAAQPAVLR